MSRIGKICATVLMTILVSTLAVGQINWSFPTAGPVLQSQFGTMYSDVYAPSVLYDSSAHLYRMWFMSRTDFQDGFSISAATSADGLTWNLYASNPVLTNGPAKSYDERYVGYPHVIKLDTVYYMYYTGFSYTGPQTISLATSSDGFHWTKLKTNPVLSYASVGEPRVCRRGAEWFMFYSVGVDIGMASSSDGVAWTPYAGNPVLTRGAMGSWDGVRLTTDALIVRDSTLYLFYGGGVTPIGFATSTDGITWEKYAGNPVFSPPSSWASRVEYGSMVLKGNKLQYWFSGNDGYSWNIGYAVSTVTNLVSVSHDSLRFGPTKIGSKETQQVHLSNLSATDTLHVKISTQSINKGLFTISDSVDILPHDSASIVVKFAPSLQGADTGKIFFTTSGLNPDSIVLAVSGKAYALTASPMILGMGILPNSYYTASLTWTRSLLDTAGVGDTVVEYSVWKRKPGAAGRAVGNRVQTGTSSTIDSSWEYVKTIPAIHQDLYYAEAQLAYTTSRKTAVFMVAATTVHGQVLLSGTDSIAYGPSSTLAVGEQSGKNTPQAFHLDQNYPNPFNPSTTIRYSLPQKGTMKLSVFDLLGREVAVLVEGDQESGQGEIRFDGSRLASGVYFYQLRMGNFVETRRFMLLK